MTDASIQLLLSPLPNSVAQLTAVFLQFKPVKLTEQHDVLGKTKIFLQVQVENVLGTAASVSQVWKPHLCRSDTRLKLVCSWTLTSWTSAGLYHAVINIINTIASIVVLSLKKWEMPERSLGVGFCPHRTACYLWVRPHLLHVERALTDCPEQQDVCKK